MSFAMCAPANWDEIQKKIKWHTFLPDTIVWQGDDTPYSIRDKMPMFFREYIPLGPIPKEELIKLYEKVQPEIQKKIAKREENVKEMDKIFNMN